MTELRRAQLVKITHGIIWATIAVVVATPLFFSGKFYFPFIYPKSLVFELAAEVMGLVFFGLLLLDRQRHIRLNPAVVLYAAVIIVELLAGIFGINIVRSFWSTFERAEGIFLHLHLLAFLFVITNFIRDRRAWLYLFDASLVVSAIVSLVSLLQYFGFDWLKDVGDTRLASTVGNASFFAGYLLFHIFIALFLYTQRHQKQGWRWFYLTAALLEVFILFQTGTRGAIIALAIGAIGLLAVVIWQSSGQVKKIAIGGLVVLVLGGAGLFILKDTPVVQNFLALRRITSLSLADRTVQTRLMTWGSATQGFLSRPVFGYGLENFNYVFNLHFSPGIYEDPGSAVWFDRAHNVVFDRLTTTGVVGLIVYGGFIGYSLLVLLRRKKENDNPEIGGAPLFMGLVIGTYVIQNLFVFDSLVTLFPLMIVMGFVSFTSQREWEVRLLQGNGVRY